MGALKFPIDYACTDKVPGIRCFTPAFHCNIDQNGTVCWGGLIAAHARKDGQHIEPKIQKDSGGYQGCRATGQNRATAFDVVKAILSLLALPVPENALVPSVAKLFMEDRRQHDSIARTWTLRYAV